MQEQRCRVCNCKLYEKPLLEYYNMPNSAQYFPSEEDLESEKGIDLFVYQCSGCGLMQLDIEPVDYYKSVIRSAGFSSEIRKYRTKFFEELVNKYNLKDKKILEVGCGSGEFLELMAQVAKLSYGVENLESSVKNCNLKGLNVEQGFIDDENYRLKNAPFDCFFIMNFLEHIPNPNEFLRGIYNNLNDDAIGLIEVPNVNKMIEDVMFSEFIRDHLMYFTQETLSILLEKNGFRVLECNVVWHDYVLSVVVKKSKRLLLNNFYNKKDKIDKEINNYIDSKISNNKKVAIWGAGHQALTLIAMTNIKDKITCIIDSATFKQGKYTQATHLKICSPELLKSGEIKVVIVMAASYSDEVTKIIQKDYSNIEIAIFREDGLEIL